MEGKRHIMNSNRRHRAISSISNPDQRKVDLLLWALILAAILLIVAGIGRALAGEDDGANVAAVPQRFTGNLPLATTREDFFLPGTQSGGLTHPITVDHV